MPKLTKIVVCENGHHDTTFVAQSNLERLSSIVELIGVSPAHAFLLLLLGGILDIGQSQILLLTLTEVRCKHDASSGACPMGRVKTCVVLGEVGISSVSKDGFDKIEVGDASSRHEEANFQALLRNDSGNFRADQRTKLKRNHALHGSFPL